MDTTVGLLRLDIDGRWSAEDFARCYASLSDLYDLRLFLELLREDQRDWELFAEEMRHFPPFRRRWKRRMSSWGPGPWPFGLGMSSLPSVDDRSLAKLCRLFEPEERLQVRRIRYSSPGFSDLAGIGDVVGHVKDFVVKLIERRDSRRQRELADERAALENDRMRLENARQFVALGRDLGYSDTDIRSLTSYVDGKQEVLARLVDQQKIRAAVEPEGEGESE